MFSLEQLQCFIAVVDERHFGRAAARLLMTQPALSRQVQRLEGAIGTSLIHRDSRRVDLTAAGLAFEPEARTVLAQAQRAARAATSAASGSTGRISIGFTATSAMPILGRLLAGVEECLPGVDVHLEELVTKAQLTRLRSGSLDLGVLRPSGLPPDFRSRLVHQERLMLVLRDDHELALGDDAIDPAELAGADMVMYSRAPARYLFDLCAAVLANVTVCETHRVTQVHTMLALVAAGRGIAIVPESAATTPPEGVVFRRLAGWDRPVVQMHAAWLPDSANPVLRRALDALDALQPTAGSAAQISGRVAIGAHASMPEPHRSMPERPLTGLGARP